MRFLYPLLAALVAALSVVAQPAEYATPDEFASYLEQLHSSLTIHNAKDVAASLPAVWTVRAGQQSYSISTNTLRALLIARMPRVNTVLPKVAEAQVWLDQCAQQIRSTKQARVGEAQKQTLHRILATAEFSSPVATETAWDRWKRKVLTSIGRFFGRLLRSAFGDSTARSVLFWIFLIVAVGVATAVVIQLWQRNAPPIPIRGTAPMLERTSQQWVQGANEAAAQGDLRRAIQCAYWAGITHLQEAAVLSRERAKTPREYLRSLNEQGGEQIEPVRTLTEQLERFWYAGGIPSENDYSLSMESLGTLGCNPA